MREYIWTKYPARKIQICLSLDHDKKGKLTELLNEMELGKKQKFLLRDCVDMCHILLIKPTLKVSHLLMKWGKRWDLLMPHNWGYHEHCMWQGGW